MFKKILHIKLKLIVLIIAALAILQLASAYAFGVIIKEQMEQEFQYLSNSPLIHVIKHQYRRGLFSSDVTTELSINSQLISKVVGILPNNQNESTLLVANSKSYTIAYTTHITHGLFAGVLHGYFVPTLAYAKTKVNYPDNVQKLLVKFFTNRDPLTITDVLYLDKSGKLSFYSPNFTYEEAVSGVKVLWNGMNLTIDYNGDFSKFNHHLSIPLFSLSAPSKGVVQLKNLTYSSATHMSTNAISIGETHLNVAHVTVNLQNKLTIGLKLGDMVHMLTNISSAEFLDSLDAINPNDFSFNNISYAADSSDVNGFFAAHAAVKFASLITNGITYGPMEFDLTISHVAASAFAQLSNAIKALIAKHADDNPATADAEQTRDEWVNMLKARLGPILVAQPIIKLNNFSLNTPTGLVHVNGMVSTKNFNLTDMDDESQFMQKLVVDISVSAPKSVLAYLFTLQMRYLLSAGNAQMDEQSAVALNKVANILLDNQIDIWTQKGYLAKRSNGILSTHLMLNNGNLQLNGK